MKKLTFKKHKHTFKVANKGILVRKCETLNDILEYHKKNLKRSKKRTFLDQMEEYLKNTPKYKAMQDWKKFQYLNKALYASDVLYEVTMIANNIERICKRNYVVNIINPKELTK